MRRLVSVPVIGVLFLAILVTTASAAFPGRNGRIVFLKDGDDRSVLYSVDPDGSRLRRITTGDYDSKLSVAPDGRTVAFSREGAIFTARMSGRHVTRLTRFGGDLEPSISGPLGRRIVFTRFGSVTSKLWLMASDGTGERQLTDPPTADRLPAFSPDGRWIAFVRPNRNRDERIYKMRSDGSGVRRLTHGKRPGGPPSFSPDGKSIVFDHPTKKGGWAIDAMRSNGTHVHRIRRGEDAAYSPNGERIVFMRNGIIHAMDRHGRHMRRVTPRGWTASNPVWAPRVENG